jgi:hypothetical protein
MKRASSSVVVALGATVVVELRSLGAPVVGSA